jgi:hypothetical protein
MKNELVELINQDCGLSMDSELKSNAFLTRYRRVFTVTDSDFINLSTNLVGVDKMIADLNKPLDKMKSDVSVN